MQSRSYASSIEACPNILHMKDIKMTTYDIKMTTYNILMIH